MIHNGTTNPASPSPTSVTSCAPYLPYTRRILPLQLSQADRYSRLLPTRPKCDHLRTRCYTTLGRSQNRASSLLVGPHQRTLSLSTCRILLPQTEPASLYSPLLSAHPTGDAIAESCVGQGNRQSRFPSDTARYSPRGLTMLQLPNLASPGQTSVTPYSLPPAGLRVMHLPNPAPAKYGPWKVISRGGPTQGPYA